MCVCFLSIWDTSGRGTVPTGIQGNGKWSGIAAFGGKLYCSPGTNSNVQVVDPVSGKIPGHLLMNLETSGLGLRVSAAQFFTTIIQNQS